jgi:integrase
MAYVLTPGGADGKLRRVHVGRFKLPNGEVNPAAIELAGRKLREASTLGGARPSPTERITVGEVARRFMECYVLVQQHGREVDHFKLAMDLLAENAGSMPALEFDSVALMALQDAMVRSRRWTVVDNINRYVQRVRRAFKWAAKMKLIPGALYGELALVEPLQAGRTVEPLRDPKEIPPIDDASMEATLKFLSPTVATMVLVQRRSGARPSEVCSMTLDQIDRSGAGWMYRPRKHKTAYKGKTRMIPLGPRCQELLAPFLNRQPAAPIFSPAEAERARRQLQHAARVTPTSVGNVPGSNRIEEPLRAPGAAYTAESYAKAIARACKRAGIPRWAPNRLRKARATEIDRSRHGLQGAAVVLGHSSAETTRKHYVALNEALALQIAEETG